MTRLALAVLLLAACDRRAPVTSCDDDLHGVWVTDTSARWMMLDNGGTLEAYPLFDDSVPAAAPQVPAPQVPAPQVPSPQVPAPQVQSAPRVIDVRRGEKLQGEVKRRYMAGSAVCEASAPIRIAKCKASGLQVVVADPEPPLELVPACKWPSPSPSRVEHWQRE